MEKELLERFDALIEQKGYENRSEALRDLARRELDRQAWQAGKPAVATIMLVYDHHVRELTERLTDIQHDYGDCILSALHVHLDHHHCLEVIAAKGPAQKLKLLAERLTLAKGVLSGDVIAAEIPSATVKKSAHRRAGSTPEFPVGHRHRHAHRHER